MSEFQRQNDRIEALEIGQQNMIRLIEGITESLKPITETYAAATRVGKWFMAFLVFISILIGVAIGLRDLIHK